MINQFLSGGGIDLNISRKYGNSFWGIVFPPLFLLNSPLFKKTHYLKFNLITIWIKL